jgi:hypothetical protein
VVGPIGGGGGGLHGNAANHRRATTKNGTFNMPTNGKVNLAGMDHFRKRGVPTLAVSGDPTQTGNVRDLDVPISLAGTAQTFNNDFFGPTLPSNTKLAYAAPDPHYGGRVDTGVDNPAFRNSYKAGGFVLGGGAGVPIDRYPRNIVRIN